MGASGKKVAVGVLAALVVVVAVALSAGAVLVAASRRDRRASKQAAPPTLPPDIGAPADSPPLGGLEPGGVGSLVFPTTSPPSAVIVGAGPPTTASSGGPNPPAAATTTAAAAGKAGATANSPGGPPTPTVRPGGATTSTTVGPCSDPAPVGATAPPKADLQAPSPQLAWSSGALLLSPQRGARRPDPSTNPVIVYASAGQVQPGGEWLLVGGPTDGPLSYTIADGDMRSNGRITFTGANQAEATSARVCPGTGRAVLDLQHRAGADATPLRVVGLVPPAAGRVSLGSWGGFVRYEATSDSTGTQNLTVLTATDAGAPGPTFAVTITIA